MLASLLTATLLAPPSPPGASVRRMSARDYYAHWGADAVDSNIARLERRRKGLWVGAGIFGATLATGVGFLWVGSMPVHERWCPGAQWDCNFGEPYGMIFTTAIALPVGAIGVLATGLGLYFNKVDLHALRGRRIELDYGVQLGGGSVTLRF